MNWPWSKTYTVRCPDGSTKIVHRNVDNAFPLHIRGWKANLVGSIDTLNGPGGQIKTEYASTIHGLLFSLDELNSGLSLTFRATYVAYQASPCTHADFLAREIAKILEEQRRILALKVQIDGLVQLALTQPDQSQKFANSVAAIVDRMGDTLAPQTTAERIDEARSIAKNLLEGQQ